MPKSILAYSKLYRSFISIEKDNYDKVILFFKENEEKIRSLNGEEFREIILEFCDALFEAGKYERYIEFSLEIIPISLEYGVPEYLYSKILFRRAASLYHTGWVTKAEAILVQLYKISPNKKEVKLLLKKCIQHRRNGLAQKIRAIAILFILLTTLISSVEVLFIRPFYELYSNVFEWAKYVLIFFAIMIVVSGVLAEQCYIRKQIEKLILESKKIN